MTDRYALFGNPLGHSKSPQIHAAFAQATGHDIAYGLVEAPPDGFKAAVHAFRDQGGRGGNVTLPFKLEACALATQTLEHATLAGAANCLKFEPDGRILAENFDGIGLVNDIETNLGFAIKGRRVLMLGAGGAARGAVAAFLGRAPSEVVVVNRHADKAQALASAFGARGKVAGCGYDDLGRDERFDLVVNATSASLQGQRPPLQAAVFERAALAYELAYGKGLTPFLRQAREAGTARVADGVGMLVEQAAEAWVWWRGVRPATKPVIERMTVPLV